MQGGGIDFSTPIYRNQANLNNAVTLSITTSKKPKLLVVNYVLTWVNYGWTEILDLEKDYRQAFGWYGGDWYYVDNLPASDFVTNISDSGCSYSPFYYGDSSHTVKVHYCAYA